MTTTLRRTSLRRIMARVPAVTGMVLVLVLAAAAPAWAGRPTCVSGRDEIALNARVLQTELMVAALACGEERRYNAFVTTFRGEIAAQASSLRRLFNRTYGAAGPRQLNAFVTRLANDASIRSGAGGGRYCAAARSLMAEALATKPGDFDRLTRSGSLSGRHGFPRCR
jgi:hypothetical protein